MTRTVTALLAPALLAPALLAACAGTAGAEGTPGFGALVKLRKACAGDIARFCPEVAPGEGRIAACLRAHRSQISKPCTEAAAPYAAALEAPRPGG